MEVVFLKNSHLLASLMLLAMFFNPLGSGVAWGQNHCSNSAISYSTSTNVSPDNNSANPTLCESLGSVNAPATIFVGTGTSVTSSSQLSAQTLVNKKFVVTGNFIVNSNLVLISCNVRMTSGASLQVGNFNFGYSVVFLKCNFYSCDNMWNGISVVGNSTKLNVSNTRIEDARTALEEDWFYLEINKPVVFCTDILQITAGEELDPKDISVLNSVYAGLVPCPRAGCAVVSKVQQHGATSPNRLYRT